MLENLLQNKGRVLGVCGLIGLLALIRANEDMFFYDPFLHYFKTDYTNAPIPEVNDIRFLMNVLARYGANTILSLGIIQLIFKNRELSIFAAVLYGVFFLTLVSALYAILHYSSENKMILFYIRRFLIQPIFLLLFVPAFYFQERTSEKNNIL